MERSKVAAFSQALNAANEQNILLHCILYKMERGFVGMFKK